MLRCTFTTVAAVALVGLSASSALAQKDIRWGTPPVGTAGHKAMVALSTLLNKEMPQYRISVLPTAGAITTVKGFATKELDAFYASDVGFEELANDEKRFKGFKAKVQRPLVQSFWSQTIEVGLAVKAANKDKYKGWRDFAGKRIFTGPLPFDTRAHTERGLNALGVKFNYVQVDLATVGSQLESGSLDATTGGVGPGRTCVSNRGVVRTTTRAPVDDSPSISAPTSARWKSWIAGSFEGSH